MPQGKFTLSLSIVGGNQARFNNGWKKSIHKTNMGTPKQCQSSHKIFRQENERAPCFINLVSHPHC